MKEFFKVSTIDQTLKYMSRFSILDTEFVELNEAYNRIVAVDILSNINLPDFARSTMDGYAVKASSTFGTSESNPAMLSIKGRVGMGQIPDFKIGIGEAAKISTGGMLPEGADSVVMIEYTDLIDETEIEIYKSVTPFQHVIDIGEDFKRGEIIIYKGQKLRPQDIGILASVGYSKVPVFKKPRVAIISTGDEIVPVDMEPPLGKIRDINTYTLGSLVKQNSGIPLYIGIVKDDYDVLYKSCVEALELSDMVLVSGGSSVGMRDFTIDVLKSLPDTEVLLHGVSIKPGKPTILAKSQGKAFWGLPGHVASAMIVYTTLVKQFLDHISGAKFFRQSIIKIPAVLSRNISSVQGRVDYVRVKLKRKDNEIIAIPIIGKSGLINTMVKADGFFEIDLNLEGMYKDELVWVTPF